MLSNSNIYFDSLAVWVCLEAGAAEGSIFLFNVLFLRFPASLSADLVFVSMGLFVILTSWALVLEALGQLLS